jgi:serine/arginine repetitive matrix protein 1
MDVDKEDSRSQTLDADLPQNIRGELKIKGQANARKSKWEGEEKM